MLITCVPYTIDQHEPSKPDQTIYQVADETALATLARELWARYLDAEPGAAAPDLIDVPELRKNERNGVDDRYGDYEFGDDTLILYFTEVHLGISSTGPGAPDMSGTGPTTQYALIHADDGSAATITHQDDMETPLVSDTLTGLISTMADWADVDTDTLFEYITGTTYTENGERYRIVRQEVRTLDLTATDLAELEQVRESE